MSDTNGKLVPKCISLCIISASDGAVKSQICETAAWDILLKWLQEADKEENYSFLIELMAVYRDLPVDLDQLTKNVCPKLIKSLSKKSDNEGMLVKFVFIGSYRRPVIGFRYCQEVERGG